MHGRPITVGCGACIASPLLLAVGRPQPNILTRPCRAVLHPLAERFSALGQPGGEARPRLCDGRERRHRRRPRSGRALGNGARSGCGAKEDQCLVEVEQAIDLSPNFLHWATVLCPWCWRSLETPERPLQRRTFPAASARSIPSLVRYARCGRHGACRLGQ